MQIYHYDPMSKKYTGETTARIDPLEKRINNKTVYLMPRCSTQSPPPETTGTQDAYFINDTWQVFERLPEPEQETQEPTFEEFKQAIQLKINEIFKADVDAIKNGVTQEEIDTFPTQEKEALEYKSDESADVPLLSVLSETRGITISDLADRVLAHAAAYKQAIGKAMGKKHALEDALAAAITIEDLQSIDVKQ